jgi:hypothetical protein
VTEKKTRLSRRSFILSVGAGSAAAAAAIVAGRSTGENFAANDKRATRGYRVTEHVNSYYRTAKV